MGELTAELCEQQKRQIAELENEVMMHRDGKIISESRRQIEDLLTKNQHLRETISKQDRMMNTLLKVVEILADRI